MMIWSRVSSLSGSTKKVSREMQVQTTTGRMMLSESNRLLREIMIATTTSVTVKSLPKALSAPAARAVATLPLGGSAPAGRGTTGAGSFHALYVRRFFSVGSLNCADQGSGSCA